MFLQSIAISILWPFHISFPEAKLPTKDIGKSHCFAYYIRKIKRGCHYPDQIVVIVSEGIIDLEHHATKEKIVNRETEPLYRWAREPMRSEPGTATNNAQKRFTVAIMSELVTIFMATKNARDNKMFMAPHSSSPTVLNFTLALSCHSV